tara:strand:+ start:101 stop:715 length:615 start_codon:yes stop_codon:yes gene_type:complete
MKQLLENWKRFLNEYHPGYGKSFEGSPRLSDRFVVLGEFLTEDDRHIVVVKTSEGPVGFYRSTGKGTGDWTKGMYLPFGGVTPDGPAVASPYWFAKMDPSHPQSGEESSKVPLPDSEYDKIGRYLSAVYGESAKAQTAHEFMNSVGYKSTEELGIKPSPLVGNNIYDSMATNVFLQKHGALGALGDDYTWWGVDEIDGYRAEKR